MKKYVFKVGLNGGRYCTGTISVNANNEEEAQDIALNYVCDKLAEALPELDIEVSVNQIKNEKEENIAYKDFEQVFIGCSSYQKYPKLDVVGLKNGKGAVQQLYFGEQGSYYAYIITDPKIKIEDKYTKVHTFNQKLLIYDEHLMRFSIYADEINIYRAGDFECIIQAIDYEN